MIVLFLWTAVFSSTCLPVSHYLQYKDHNGNKGFWIPFLCYPLYMNMVCIIIIISCHIYHIMYNVFMLWYSIQKQIYLSNQCIYRGSICWLYCIVLYCIVGWFTKWIFMDPKLCVDLPGIIERCNTTPFAVARSIHISGIYNNSLSCYYLMPHFDALTIYGCGEHCEKRRNCL